jgi:hypothetical protein
MALFSDQANRFSRRPEEFFTLVACGAVVCAVGAATISDLDWRCMSTLPAALASTSPGTASAR